MPKTKFISNKLFFICICTILTILTFSCANLLSSLLVKNTIISSSAVHSSPFSISFLSLYSCDTIEDANNKARKIYTQNGAGYVLLKDGKYHVLASGYESKNDASLVKSNLETQGVTCEIIDQTYSQITINGEFTSDEKAVLENSLSAFYKAYKGLYDVSLSLDTNVITETNAKLLCNDVLSGFSSSAQNFTSLLSENYKGSILSLSKSLNSAKLSLTNLCNGKKIDETQTFSSQIKYRYIEILDIYKNLISMVV